MNDKVQDIVDSYAALIKHGVSPEGAATMAAALAVVRELDIISDMLDSIDSRLLSVADTVVADMADEQ